MQVDSNMQQWLGGDSPQPLQSPWTSSLVAIVIGEEMQPAGWWRTEEWEAGSEILERWDGERGQWVCQWVWYDTR